VKKPDVISIACTSDFLIAGDRGKFIDTEIRKSGFM
jgi:hypothetical protein